MSNPEGPLSGYEPAKSDARAANAVAFARQVERKLACGYGGGPETDVILCTRAELVRNLSDFPFLTTCTEQERRSICARLRSAVSRSDAHFDMDIPQDAWLANDTARLLVEAGVLGDGGGAAFSQRADGLWAYADSDGVFLIANERDHVTLRALAPGLQPQELWDVLNGIDDALAPSLSPAFHPDWGYLSPAIDRIGTGLRVRVVLHAPGLVMEGALPELETGMREVQCGLAAWRGTLAKPQGAFLTLENAATIGRHEEELVHQVRQKAQELAAREREARQRMRDGYLGRAARDTVSRAAALAKSVRLLDYEEGLDLLSGLRLGLALGWVRGTDYAVIDRLRVESQGAHIAANVGVQQLLAPDSGGLDESEMRANVFREIFAGVEIAL